MTAYPLTESGARYIAELLLQRAQALTYLEPRDASIFGALPIPILVDSVVDLAKSGADAFDVRGVVIATLITLGLGAPAIARAESTESGADASGDVRDDAASGEEGLPPTAARAAELRLEYRKRLETLGLPLREITRKALENYERSGQFPEALVNASTLLYLDATDADAIFAFCRNLSRIAETDEHPEVALAVTERALAVLPDHIDLLDIAASLAYNRGDDETATRHWNHAYHCADREGGDDSEMIHRLYSNWKSAENRGKLTRAFALGDRGRISEAMPLLRELEPIFSDYWLFCHYYGVAHFSAQSFGEAERWFSEAIRLNSGDYASYRFLGSLAMKRQNWDVAREYLNESLRIQPLEADTLGMLAVIDVRLGKVEDARKKLAKARDIEPGNEWIRDQIASLA